MCRLNNPDEPVTFPLNPNPPSGGPVQDGCLSALWDPILGRTRDTKAGECCIAELYWQRQGDSAAETPKDSTYDNLLPYTVNGVAGQPLFRRDNC